MRGRVTETLASAVKSSSSLSDRASSSSSVARHLGGARRIRVGVIVAHDQLTGGVVVADQFLQLQLELTAVGAQLDHVGVDLQADPAHHLQALRHRHHVAQRHEVLDLGGGQLPVDLVEAGLVALQGGDGLVGPGQDGRRVSGTTCRSPAAYTVTMLIEWLTEITG